MNVQLNISTITPKQRQFFASTTRYTAYGGARGGGKSWAVQKKAQLMALRYPGIRIIILRHTFQELLDNHILPLMKDLQGIADYKSSDKRFFFPNGSTIIFGYCDSLADELQYQGKEYDVIFLDEATQFHESTFRILTASLRGANDFPKRFYITCNPGGVGHSWVKRLFVDRRFEDNENPDDYTFIQANVRDNPVLMEKDPDYVRSLESLPPDRRAAWLDGRWDVYEGQYFTNFSMRTHVIKPFEIPKHWNRFFAADYGLDMLAGYWGATDEEGHLYLYRELYHSGLKISEAAQQIRQATDGENILAYWFPPDVWGRVRIGDRTLPEIMSAEGIFPTQVNNNRVQGWMNLLEWMQIKEDGKPGIMIFEGRCPHLVESIPYMQHSQRDPNDVDTEPHQFSHAPDALRYLVVGRPWATSPILDDDEEEMKRDSYDDFLSYGV